MRMYAIMDRKIGYNTPFEQKTDDVAKRNFKATAQAEGSMIKMFPEDYTLWFMGYYDEQTGLIDQTINNKPCQIMRGDEAI